MSNSLQSSRCSVCCSNYINNDTHMDKLMEMQIPLKDFCQQFLKLNCITTVHLFLCPPCIEKIIGAMKSKYTARDLKESIRNLVLQRRDLELQRRDLELQIQSQQSKMEQVEHKFLKDIENLGEIVKHRPSLTQRLMEGQSDQISQFGDKIQALAEQQKSIPSAGNNTANPAMSGDRSPVGYQRAGPSTRSLEQRSESEGDLTIQRTNFSAQRLGGEGGSSFQGGNEVQSLVGTKYFRHDQ